MADRRTAARVLEDIADRLDGRGDDASRLQAERLRWALAEFLGDGPADTDRRDALLAEAAARYCATLDSRSARAERLRSALVAFAAGPWLESCHLAEPPPRHRDKLAGMCWQILKADPAVLSTRQLRKKLALGPGKGQPARASSPPKRSIAP